MDGASLMANHKIEIRRRNIEKILQAAEKVFAEKGYGANQRLSATYGYGDLAEQGFNAYVSAHYLKSAAVYNKDLGYPYNSDDLSGICHDGVCGPNNMANGVDPSIGFTGLSTATNVFMARPYDAATGAGTGR